MAITATTISTCKEIMQTLLDKLGIQAEYNLRATEEMIAIDIDSEESKALIGYKGETLGALQTIVSMILSKELKERVYVSIDVNNYRERRETALTKMAKRAAEEVMLSGKPITLEPMQPFERRIVHMVLQSYPELTSESEGDGTSRCVVIRPEKTA
jgi:spoIIIJ-associated protein